MVAQIECTLPSFGPMFPKTTLHGILPQTLVPGLHSAPLIRILIKPIWHPLSSRSLSLYPLSGCFLRGIPKCRLPGTYLQRLQQTRVLNMA